MYSNQKGFIGLLAILICAAVILIVMFGRNKIENGEENKSMIETQLDAKKGAMEMKERLENREYDLE